MKKDIVSEIKNYSLKDLKLIIDTQQDLYTPEEMKAIQAYYESAKQKYVEKNLPKVIKCPKCDAENDFKRKKCEYCGEELDNSIYYEKTLKQAFEYDDDYSEAETENNKSFIFNYIISFFIPLVGFIMGGIMLASKDEESESVGRTCIIIGIVSMIISGIIYVLIRV